MWIGLQLRLGRELDARERITAFILEYATYLLNHLQIGEDGKVPYERVRGKKHQILGLEFGEKVLFRFKEGTKKPKLEDRWGKGIFVGIRSRSQEVMVSTVEGIWLSRAIKRAPEEERWTEDTVNWVMWAPWHRYQEDENEDGEVPEGVQIEERKEGTPSPEEKKV